MKTASTSSFIISLDFELFWGVTDTKSIESYGANIEGVWQAIPAMLKLFEQYDVNATWATVGMLMCRDYDQWVDIKPSIMPTYSKEACLTYASSALAQQHPHLFFARPLVEQILAGEGQELASHTYSHFYCGDSASTVEQFAADLKCVKTIFADYNIDPKSIVIPRNQVLPAYLKEVAAAGYNAFRGNQLHWVYQDGHFVPLGILGKVFRLADSYLPLTGNPLTQAIFNTDLQLCDVPASCFLRPSGKSSVLDSLHLRRIKGAMLSAAKQGGMFHLWWHPHNFGINLAQNLATLQAILKYYVFLKDQYGMQSKTMAAMADSCIKTTA